MSRGPSPTWALRAGVAIARHPSLWPTAFRQVRRLAPAGWWHRFPFLPVPDRSYLRFRIITAYGGDGTRAPDAHDLVTYLHWCRAWPSVTSSVR